MKKVTTFLLVIVLSLLCVCNVSASENNIYMEEDSVNSFVCKHFSQAENLREIPMYDLKENITAWLYIVEPYGYFITDSTKQVVVEYSEELTINIDSSAELFYGGPLRYYFKENDLYYEYHTKQVVSADILAKEVNCFKATTATAITDFSYNNAMDTLGQARSIYANRINRSFKTFSINDDGRCGSVAAAILLCYYNDYGYSGLVPSIYYNNEIYFTNYLFPHIEGTTWGSDTPDLVSGLNWYLGTWGYSSVLTATSISNGSFTIYENKINSNIPVILDLDAEPTYGEHWVVGYGYSYEYTNYMSNIFAVVDDGWGNLGVYINWQYVDDFVFLNK